MQSENKIFFQKIKNFFREIQIYNNDLFGFFFQKKLICINYLR